MRQIIGNIIQANKIFDMIKNHDKIAIGVSGGKDSIILLQAMQIYCQKQKQNFNWNIKIKGFCVDLGFKKNSLSTLVKWCKKHKLPLQVIKSNIAQVLKSKKRKGKVQCSLCAKMKKAILIRTIKKQGFNKLAFGHHAEDAIETLFMNIMSQSRMAIFQPLTFLDREKIYLIRPMIMCREKQIITLSKKLQIPIAKSLCPNERITQRTYMKKFIEKNFYQNTNWPNAYTNLYRCLFNKKGCNLWIFNPKYNFDNLQEAIVSKKKI